MRTSKTQQCDALLQFRLARSKHYLANLQQIERRFPWYRLAALVAGLVVVYLGFRLLPVWAGWGVAVLAFAAFMLITVRHRYVIDRIALLETFCHMLSTHIARLNLDWDHIPAPADIPISLEHPFASDLNITGPRSLHQLLDTTITLGGSQRLAGWLLSTQPDPAQITFQQQLVRELTGLPAFRERLELDGLMAYPEHTPRWDVAALERWIAQENPANSSGLGLIQGSLGRTLILQSCLAAFNLAFLILNLLGILPPIWVASFLIYLGLQALQFTRTSAVFDESYSLAQLIGKILPILTSLEQYPYPSGSQIEQQAAPITRGVVMRPTTTRRRLGWIISASSLRGNPFISLIMNFLMPWDLFLAYQLERYRASLSVDLPHWLDSWYEIEALSALANFAALNPDFTFPILNPPGATPILQCKAIGHPLIPDATRVSNNFSLQRLGEVVIITGSNMSGKSTFLRTLGANLALAYAGSPVAAQELRLIPFRIFTSMNLSDSLSDGISFFYAEVRRLKALLNALDASQPYPLFFLIDEIFRGTNNRERQIGSQAFTQALAGKNGAGLISTHDLELAHLAYANAWLSNHHFREDIQGSQMVFNYKIRPGASPTTNALRIMALAGLPVPRQDNPT